MRVLFQNRPDALTKRGGDTIQMLKTKEGLERLGVEVDIVLDPVSNYRGYDLIHLFNIQCYEEAQALMQPAKAAGKIVALSPIWWSMTEYELYRPRRPRWNQVRRILGTRIAGGILDWWLRMRTPNPHVRKWLVQNADLLLPNSIAERDILVREFSLSLDRTIFQIVHYAVDGQLFDGADPKRFVEKYGLKAFVLCAARIENRKNQLNLMRAMEGIEMPLVLIGAPNANQRDYVSVCRAMAEKRGPGRVHFIDHLDQNELASAYAAAKVHALVSWFESPGLASMEAAVAGCNIVTTDRAPVDEYFGDLAWRCDPSSVRSIRDAIVAALAAPRRTALRDKILAAFTWEHAAQETLNGYEMALRKR